MHSLKQLLANPMAHSHILITAWVGLHTSTSHGVFPFNLFLPSPVSFIYSLDSRLPILNSMRRVSTKVCKSASCCTALLGQTWKTMVKDFLGFSKLLNKKVKKENPRFCIKSVVKLDNLLSSCTYYGSNVVILVTFISQTVISSIWLTFACRR